MPKNFDAPSHENKPSMFDRGDAMAELLTPEEWGCVRGCLREAQNHLLVEQARMRQGGGFEPNLQYDIQMINTILEKTA